MLTPSIEALRTLVLTHEPVEFINAIAIPASMALLGKGPTIDDAPATTTWAAKIEYVVSLALSGPPGAGHTSTVVTEKAIDLLADIFDAANAKLLLGLEKSESADLNEASFLLRLEDLYDRMSGYARHLEQIDAEVFDRQRAFYLGAVHFNPADVGRVVRRRTAMAQQRADTLLRDVQASLRRQPEVAAEAMKALFATLDGTRVWNPEVVAAETGVAGTEVLAMLRFFSTTFGSQPDFREPTDKSPLRTRPCIDLGDNLFFVPDPWSLQSSVHFRLAEAAAEDPSGPLRRYWGHRQDGHERLTAQVFMRVFGDDLVRANRHYASTAGGPGEIDVLVRSESPVVVEAKAQALTESGRRGAPGRVKRVSQDLVETAIRQTTRARNYIVDESGRSFADREGGAPTVELPDHLTGLTEVVVTFERMDPIGRKGPGVVDLGGHRAWIVCLADLLMVADLLTDTASFHHYLRIRADMAALGPVVHMESDALGAYLSDRLVAARERAAADRDVTVMLGYTSSRINEYFTQLELGRDVDRPDTGVPKSVLGALEATAGRPSGIWTAAVDDVMVASPAKWRQWRSFWRRHKGRGVFELSERVDIVGGQSELTNHNGHIQIQIPTD